MLVPRRKVAKLSLYVSSGTRDVSHIVAIVGHPHFRTNEHNLAIVDDNAAVVVGVLVGKGPVCQYLSSRLGLHADITDDILCFFALQDLGKDLPRVGNSVLCMLAPSVRT